MVAVQKQNNMRGKRKLKNLDKRVQKKNLQKTKNKLSKLSNSELELMRQGGKLAKGESKADYIKRRKGEMSKSSPAKIVPIIAAIGKAALAAGKVAKGVGAVVKGVKAGAALAKGVKAVGTAQKIGKAIGTAKKVIGTAKAVQGTMDAMSPKNPNRSPGNKGMQKFSQMQFGKSPNKMVVKLPHPIRKGGGLNEPAPRRKIFNTASAFKMKGFSGFGNKKSPVKAGQTAGQIIRRERLMN